jgi:hypothetical protein
MSRVIVLSLLAFLAAAQSLSACSIPVFRFALERWTPDLFEVSVFCRGTLSDLDEQRVMRLEDQAVRNGGQLNLEVVRCNLDEGVPADLIDVWKSLNDAPLPTVVVRTPRRATGQSLVWHGRLNDPFLDTLVGSPARREIVQRLLHGDSVVWLFVRGRDAEQADRTRKSLDVAIAQAAEQIELPAGIGRPGSELLAKVPLHLKFSVVEIAAEASDEQILLHLLRSALPQPPRDGDSLIAPIFGRGRVLAVQSARDLEPETITDLTTYLCSACSCQVKQQNPGFDLLCEMNWDERLFGGATDPAAAEADSTDIEPALVAIPSGQATRDPTPNSGPIVSPSARRGHTLVYLLAALGAAASLIALTRR